MALREGFGAELALPHADDLRLDLAGIVVRTSAGVVRGGIFPPQSSLLSSSGSSMAVHVAAFSGVGVRDGGPVFIANDGSANITIAAAPSSNSRIDVMYAIQHDASAHVLAPDADNLPVFGVSQGVAAPSPVRNPAGLPAGAIELGTILVPSTATNTASAGVVITETFTFTAMTGGVVLCRNGTEMTGWTPADGALAVQLNTGTLWQRVSGSWAVASSSDSGWITVTFANSWTSSAGLTVQYRKLNGVVYLRGRPTGGTTNTMFTLPAGFRPGTSNPTVILVENGSTVGAATSIGIASTGVVTGTSGSFPVLDGITFIADN